MFAAIAATSHLAWSHLATDEAGWGERQPSSRCRKTISAKAKRVKRWNKIGHDLCGLAIVDFGNPDTIISMIRSSASMKILESSRAIGKYFLTMGQIEIGGFA